MTTPDPQQKQWCVCTGTQQTKRDVLNHVDICDACRREIPPTAPQEETINDAIRRIVGGPGTLFQLEQLLTRYCIEKCEAANDQGYARAQAEITRLHTAYKGLRDRDYENLVRATLQINKFQQLYECANQHRKKLLQRTLQAEARLAALTAPQEPT